jgi:hypothetical protein
MSIVLISRIIRVLGDSHDTTLVIYVDLFYIL